MNRSCFFVLFCIVGSIQIPAASLLQFTGQSRISGLLSPTVAGSITPSIMMSTVQVMHQKPSSETGSLVHKKDWTLDILVILLYLGGTVAFGLWVSRKQSGLEDYFLGGRKIPWGAALLSMVATEISAATFLGAPEQGYLRNFTYLQFGIGSIIARIVLAFVFLGIFYRLKVYTVYGFLAQRFGYPTKNTAAGAFLLGRFFAAGSRLFIASLAVKVVTGMDFTYSITLLGAISIFYTLFGGITAVIWTDVIQALILIGGAVLSVMALMNDIPLSLVEIFTMLRENSKLMIFDTGGFGGNMDFLGNPYNIFPALVGGFFLTMATHGTDQSMIQRLLTCKDSFRGKLSLILSGFLGLAVAAIFLFIGMLLFVFISTRSDGETMKLVADQLRESGQNGNLYLFYIMERIPPGMAGLIIASVLASAMSSIDSELNAMSSTFVNDFYLPYFQPKASDKTLMNVARLSTLLCGVILVFLAILISRFYLRNPETDLLTIALGIMTLFYGGLLGVFLVGLLTRRRGNSWSNIVAMATSLVVIGVIANKATLLPALGLVGPGLSQETNLWSGLFHLKLAWPWFIVVGTGVTVAIALLGITSQKVLDRFYPSNSKS